MSDRSRSPSRSPRPEGDDARCVKRKRCISRHGEPQIPPIERLAREISHEITLKGLLYALMPRVPSVSGPVYARPCSRSLPASCPPLQGPKSLALPGQGGAAGESYAV